MGHREGGVRFFLSFCRWQRKTSWLRGRMWLPAPFSSLLSAGGIGDAVTRHHDGIRSDNCGAARGRRSVSTACGSAGADRLSGPDRVPFRHHSGDRLRRHRVFAGTPFNLPWWKAAWSDPTASGCGVGTPCLKPLAGGQFRYWVFSLCPSVSAPRPGSFRILPFRSLHTSEMV